MSNFTKKLNDDETKEYIKKRFHDYKEETKEFIQIKCRKWNSKQESIKAAPIELVNLFGKPFYCDKYKVSGEYYFYDQDGNEVTLYDWKCTSLYDLGYQSPESFWASEEIQTFSIGASEKPQALKFKDWLIEKLHTKEN